MKKLEALAETKYLSLYKSTYKNKEQEERSWIIASRKDYETLSQHYFEGKEEKIDAVVLIALHEESQKIVLIKQFRVPLNDYVYELPAGLIDQGEDIAETVKRELREETGLELISIKEHLSHKQTYLSPGMTEESAALIYCTCKGEISTEHLEADEDITPLLLSKEEAKKLLKDQPKIDIKAFMALQSFVQLGDNLMN